MKIKQIEIRDFRNIAYYVYNPEKVNVFTGVCGAGKTSVLCSLRALFFGEIAAKDIRCGAKKAEISARFENGDEFSVARTPSTTVFRWNGQKINKGDVRRKVKECLKFDTEDLRVTLDTDFFDTITKKELNSLLLPALQDDICLKKALEILRKSGEVTKEQEEILGKYLPEMSFGLQVLESGYQNAFQDRRYEKRVLEDLATKAKYEGDKPLESKEALQSSLDEITRKELKSAELDELKEEWERANAEYEAYTHRKEALEAELSGYSEITPPDEPAKTKAEDDMQKFNDAIAKSSAIKATAEGNIKLFRKVLDGLDKPVCPISEKLVCTADRKGAKAEFEQMVAKNEQVIAERNAFIKRCAEQVDMRKKMIASYYEQKKAWDKKQSITETLSSMTPPYLPPEPEVEEGMDWAAEKGRINDELQKYTLMEAAQKAKEAADKQQKLVDLLEWVCKVLDVHTGIRASLFKEALRPLSEKCNREAAKLGRDYSFNFQYNDGLEVSIKPGADKSWVDIHDASTGEFVFVVYILQKAACENKNTPYLIIDNIDKLDKEYVKQFLELIIADDDYTHVFIGGVNHPDFMDSLKSTGIRYYELDFKATVPEIPSGIEKGKPGKAAKEKSPKIAPESSSEPETKTETKVAKADTKEEQPGLEEAEEEYEDFVNNIDQIFSDLNGFSDSDETDEAPAEEEIPPAKDAYESMFEDDLPF